MLFTLRPAERPGMGQPPTLNVKEQGKCGSLLQALDHLDRKQLMKMAV